ncbi:hypothetical protein WSM22_47370 [Cytophagales bacterium WSM2-2]|nr:hypothetical protein WSM22_47370 [Cytophagales bacterium WSM2-2]
MSLAADVTRAEPLTFKKYPGFNFNEFKPVEGTLTTGESYYRVGLNSKNDIRELIYFDKDSLSTYRMVVFNYEDRRVLGIGTLKNSQGYFFWSVVIIMDKRTNFNYLMSTSANINHKFGGRIWIDHFDKISNIMILDENLLPRDLFRIKNGQVVVHSELKCEGDRVVSETANLFSIQDIHDLKIDFSTCPEILKRTCRDETPDLTFRVRASPEKKQHLPIWVRVIANNVE